MTKTPALTRMIGARTALVLDEAFFGTLALKLQLVEDPSCPTAWTDGTHLGFNPNFVLSLSREELIALFEHEVMHCANGHPWRRDGREPRRWNEACDRAINPIIRNAGGKLPEGALFELEPSHAGMSAEWVFARIPQPQGNQGDQSQQGNGQGQGEQGQGSSQQPGEQGKQQSKGGKSGSEFGEVRDAPTTSQAESKGEGEEEGTAAGSEEIQTEADWEQAVQQAAQVAKSQGKLPGGMERLAKDIAQNKVDWRSVLARFVQEHARADYSWNRPNARYMPSGLYLPGLHNEEMGAVALAIDTSGSIDRVALEQFRGEVNQIVSELRPRQVSVMYCDSKLHRVDTFSPDDEITFRPVGGGGTSFVPVFEALDTLEEPPVCVVYFTDMYGRFPEAEPAVPTLWVSTSRVVEAPFGEVVPINT